MTAKEYLRQYEEANRKAARHKAEYEKEQELIDGIRSSLGGDGTPHSPGISRKVEDMAIKLTDKLLEWKMAELDAIRLRQEVYETIAGIEGIEGELLYERYINLHKWEEICILLHYSWHGVHAVHRRALAIVERALNGTHTI